MTQDEITRIADLAFDTSGIVVPAFSNGFYTVTPEELQRFATIVAAAERRKHQADIERWKAEAATAEKWRGLALSKDGDGRCVQRIQQEAAEKEREACALLVEKKCAENWVSVDKVAAAIRARGQQ